MSGQNLKQKEKKSIEFRKLVAEIFNDIKKKNKLKDNAMNDRRKTQR